MNVKENYKFRFKIEFDFNNGKGWTPQEYENMEDKELYGLADNLLFFNILEDEKKKSLVPYAVFNDSNLLWDAWMAMAYTLSKIDIHEEMKNICMDVLTQARPLDKNFYEHVTVDDLILEANIDDQKINEMRKKAGIIDDENKK